MRCKPLANPLWIDQIGDYHSWLKELWAWEEARNSSADVSAFLGRPASQQPLPRLTFLLLCLDKLRAEPHIAKRITAAASKYGSLDKMPEADAVALSELISFYLRHLEIKSGNENNLSVARASLFPILFEQEVSGERSYEASAQMVRRENLASFYIDDIKDG